jgi:hypothetical protein
MRYIENMKKTEKELAFLRGLTVEPEWTQKFTDIFDETVKIKNIDTLTYINAGAGNHAIELQEKLGETVEVFPVCETKELQKIARVKAGATGSDLDFSTRFPLAQSDFVVADASLVRPAELNDFLVQAVRSASGDVVFFLPTAGSFGEVFSYLWEVFLELDLLAKGADIEQLVTALPTVAQVEEMFGALRMKKIKTTTRNVFFDFETGADFIEAPLVKFFFLPVWLGFLSDPEKERVTERLVRKIDEDCGEMSFRFTVKATVMGGRRL